MGMHRRPKETTRLRRGMVAAAMTGVIGTGSTLVSVPVSEAATVSVWDRVAACESSGNWSINTGNGFFGGLQFSGSTWLAYGGGAYAATADRATKDEQIIIGQRVLNGWPGRAAAQGPGAWPVCGPRAGLTEGGPVPQFAITPKPAAKPKPKAVVKPKARTAVKRVATAVVHPVQKPLAVKPAVKAVTRPAVRRAVHKAVVHQATASAASRAVAFALDQVGKPYVFGGTGPNVFDCSGLVMEAWKHAGVSVPRTSEAQASGLRRVPDSEVRPGDIIVYYGGSHVGLYIGHGDVVVAENPLTGIRVRTVGYDAQGMGWFAVRPA